MNFSDKNSKQINAELKTLKSKLNEIMMKDIESEETILEEAYVFKENIESQYKASLISFNS